MTSAFSWQNSISLCPASLRKNMNLDPGSLGSNLTLPLATSKVTLGRLPEGSVPQFPFLSGGDRMAPGL